MDTKTQKSMTALGESSNRLMTEAEVAIVRDAVLSSDRQFLPNRGVALALLEKARNGHVLSNAENVAVSSAFTQQGEPFFHAFQAIKYSDQSNVGVRSPELIADARARMDPSSCACQGRSCSECSSCPFVFMKPVGGSARSKLLRPTNIRVGEEGAQNGCGCK